jgi:Uma2 family endonuclease
MLAAIPDPFPETKPATEFIGGRLVQKMSPNGLHARVQAAVARALSGWAETHAPGRVGTEWDIDLTPPEEGPNRLVPDVAYISYERISYDDDDAAEIPTVAPNVVVEVLSPGQTMAQLAEKLRIYLAARVELAIFVDPRRQYAVLHDATGSITVTAGGTLAHAALPAFSIPLSSIFAKQRPRRKP